MSSALSLPPALAAAVGATLLLTACPEGAEMMSSATEATTSDDGDGLTSTSDSASDGPLTAGPTSSGTTADIDVTGGGATSSTTGDSTTEDPSTTDDSTSTTSGANTTSTSDATTGAATDAGLCGDGEVGEGEECDAGEDNGIGEYGGCNDDCTLQPGCNDGEHQPEHEECDPSDPLFVEAAICTDACTWDGVIVFVTSTTTTGELGGLAGADAICQGLADDAGLQVPEKYRAWLSVGKMNAADRVPLVEDAYYRLDGEIIAANSVELLGGKLQSALMITETQEEVGSSRVWTNSSPAGKTAVGGDCQSFSSANYDDKAPVGLSNKTDGQWTDIGSTLLCNQQARLYCFSAAF
ncbi:MAG: hypothetical protein R3A79_26685 [Nannocystaceae bacterium]